MFEVSGCVLYTEDFKPETSFLRPSEHKLSSDWICNLDVGLYNQGLTWFKISQGIQSLYGA